MSRRRDLFGLGQFEQPPRLHGRRATLDFEWLQRFRANVGLDQPVCAVAEQDLPRLCPLLQPRGDVDGVAGGEDLPPLSAADKDVAGVHADADGELDSARLHQLVAECRHRVA